MVVFHEAEQVTHWRAHGDKVVSSDEMFQFVSQQFGFEAQLPSVIRADVQKGFVEVDWDRAFVDVS